MDKFQEDCREQIETVIETFGVNHVVEALRDISQTQIEHAAHDSSGYGRDAQFSWLGARGTFDVLLRYVLNDEAGAFGKIERRSEAKGTLPTRKFVGRVLGPNEKPPNFIHPTN